MAWQEGRRSTAGSCRARPSSRIGTDVRRAVAALLTAAALTACVSHPVGPARSFETYEDKATTTAEAALSAVATTRLAADTGAAGDAWGSYLGVVVSEQEDAIGGVQATFASVQPPDERADALRAELDAILQPAVSHVADVRIAVRRGQLDDLSAVAEPLTGDAVRLRAFVDAHQ
jgi:hypothetical protein